MKKTQRPLKSISLPQGIIDSLANDVKNFLSTEKQHWYIKKGIPYRRGYLLYGPPGTGKSTCVHCHLLMSKPIRYFVASTIHALVGTLSLLPEACLIHA